MDIKRKIALILFGTVFVLTAVFVIMLSLENSDIVTSTKESAAVTFGLTLTYTLIAIIIGSVLFMSVRGLINKPKSAVAVLVGVAILVAIFFICYAIDTGEVTETYIKGGIETRNASKIVGGALKATFVLLLATVGFSVFLSVKELINKRNG